MQIIKRSSGTEVDISRQETELKSKGYQQVNKTNEKELALLEYIKSSHSGNEHSFEGPIKYQLAWLE